MQEIPSDAFGSPDRDGLCAFLKYCQQKAVASNHPILASITLPSDYLDPLAVLQSVNDSNAEHCYIERPSKHEGVACAEAVLSFSDNTPDRFFKAKAFCDEWKDHAVFVGETNLPWSGPHFYVSAAFEDEIRGDAAFLTDSFMMFLPRWQVGWNGASFSATANIIVSENVEIDELIEPIWRAHERFSSFDFQPNSDETLQEDNNDALVCEITNQESSETGYLKAVDNAIDLIKQGALDKVVVSRSIDIHATQGRFSPLDYLNLLRSRFPDCCAFSFQNNDGQSIIGATPERLIKVSDGRFETEALAGSIERGSNARMDAYLSKQLLSSQKDRKEHGLVLQFIQEKLVELGLSPEISKASEILQLANIQHLRVPVSGEMKGNTGLFDLLHQLHPTPALGGYPKTEAKTIIAELEPTQRDRYAGLTGWVNLNGDGEFTVNIRCALMNPTQATLYAGAGIVADSESEKELKETELKLIGMLPNFMNLD